MYFYQTLAFMNLEVHVSTHSYDSRSLGRDSDIFEKNHYKVLTVANTTRPDDNSALREVIYIFA